MNRRYTLMAAALIETDDYFPDGRKQRLYWVKPWMQEKSLSVHNLLYKLERDPDEYKRLLRVSHDVFLQLLARIEARLQKRNTSMRCPISPATRLQLLFGPWEVSELWPGTRHDHALTYAGCARQLLHQMQNIRRVQAWACL